MISIIILTKNEEKNIADCIKAINTPAEIIVVDDFSEDSTVKIAESIKGKNIKVFKRRLNSNFSSQRNFGLEKASNDWVLFLDADERVDDKFMEEVVDLAKSEVLAGYRVKRKDMMLGKVLKHGETGDISLVRLGRKSTGKWRGDVHEVWEIDGEIGETKNYILHYPHESIREFLSEVDFYTSIRANELKKQGLKSSLLQIVLYPNAKFFINYFLKLGFLDGVRGMVFALMMSLHSFLVRAKLWQLTKK